MLLPDFFRVQLGTDWRAFAALLGAAMPNAASSWQGWSMRPFLGFWLVSCHIYRLLIGWICRLVKNCLVLANPAGAPKTVRVYFFKTYDWFNITKLSHQLGDMVILSSLSYLGQSECMFCLMFWVVWPWCVLQTSDWTYQTKLAPSSRSCNVVYCTVLFFSNLL